MIAAAVERVMSRLWPLGSARLVCTVAGESGVGKTTLARALASRLDQRGARALVIHQDDYFRLPPRANHRRRVEDLSWVGPREVDLERLAADLRAFLQGAATLALPTVDESADRFAVSRHDVSDVRVLVVEGTYVTVLEDTALRVFVRGSADSTRNARRLRGREAIEAITDTILRREHELIARHEAEAHLVLEQISPS